jgi:transposase
VVAGSRPARSAGLRQQSPRSLADHDHDLLDSVGRFDGPTDTEVFRVYVAQVLCPTRRAGDIVILDNLAPHKAAAIVKLIEAVGAMLQFLPAYSPDLNPIEKMWSKIKALLRAAEARTVETLVGALGHALKCITKQDAINWFASCGYSII